MALFAAYKVTVDDVERELNRRLSGDPSSGELAVILAMNALRLDNVRERLDQDESLGRDFVELIEQKLLHAGNGEFRSWTVHVPLALWDEYARLGRVGNISVSQSLAAAIQRDAVRRRSALDTAASLEESVRAYHRGAGQVLDEIKAVVERLGAIQDLAIRMTRIEKALGSMGASR